MSPVYVTRRRAEAFHSLVESATPSGPRDLATEDLLAVVAGLRAVPVAEPRPEFVAGLRAELLDAADSLLRPTGDQQRLAIPRSARRDRRIAAAIGGIAVVGAGTSMAVAAQSALPGEMLYPLKRAIEDTGTAVDADPQVRGPALLDLASSRLDELAALQRQGDLGDDTLEVSSAFVDFGDQATRASEDILGQYDRTGEQQLIEQLRDFTGASMTALEALESQVPVSARDELLAAVAVVQDIDDRAEQACPACGGAGVDQIPPVLLSSAATGRGVVVIPGATVEAWSPRGSEPGGGAGPESGSGPRSGGAGGSTGAGGDGGSGDAGTDPLGDLTDGLLGDGDVPASGGGQGGGPGGGVGDGLGDAVDKTTDKVKKTGKRAGKKVRDTVGDVVDDVLDPPLLGGD